MTWNYISMINVACTIFDGDSRAARGVRAGRSVAWRSRFPAKWTAKRFAHLFLLPSVLTYVKMRSLLADVCVRGKQKKRSSEQESAYVHDTCFSVAVLAQGFGGTARCLLYVQSCARWACDPKASQKQPFKALDARAGAEKWVVQI